MATANARIPVLVTQAQKADILQKAKAAGLSIEEYMRRAAEAFHPSKDELVLDAVLDQMIESTNRAQQAIDDALKIVAESNRRIAEIEAQRKAS